MAKREYPDIDPAFIDRSMSWLEIILKDAQHGEFVCAYNVCNDEIIGFRWPKVDVQELKQRYRELTGKGLQQLNQRLQADGERLLVAVNALCAEPGPVQWHWHEGEVIVWTEPDGGPWGGRYVFALDEWWFRAAHLLKTEVAKLTPVMVLLVKDWHATQNDPLMASLFALRRRPGELYERYREYAEAMAARVNDLRLSFGFPLDQPLPHILWQRALEEEDHD